MASSTPHYSLLLQPSDQSDEVRVVGIKRCNVPARTADGGGEADLQTFNESSQIIGVHRSAILDNGATLTGPLLQKNWLLVEEIAKDDEGAVCPVAREDFKAHALIMPLNPRYADGKRLKAALDEDSRLTS